MAGVVFSSSDAQRIMRAVAAWERSPQFGSGVGKIPFRENAVAAGNGAEIIFIKAPEGGIPPRASNLLGSATCDKYVINNTGQLEDSTDDVTVVNWATTAVCSNGLRYGVAAFFDGEWVVISEDCADESGPVQPAGGGYTSGTILSDFPDLESTITPDVGFYTSGSHSRSSNVTGGFE